MDIDEIRLLHPGPDCGCGFSDVTPWTLAQGNRRYWVNYNPFADKPLTDFLGNFPSTLFSVEEDMVHRRPGPSRREILGLHDGWPELGVWSPDGD